MLQRGHGRHAAAQQHADGAVQARELVEAQLLADRRQARDPGAEASARGRPAQAYSRRADAASAPPR